VGLGHVIIHLEMSQIIFDNRFVNKVTYITPYKNVHIYPEYGWADKMRMNESSQSSTARLWVNLILDQCLQNKAFESV